MSTKLFLCTTVYVLVTLGEILIIFIVLGTIAFISKEVEGARWVDANIRARESVEQRRQVNMLERRSLDEIDMSVDELLQLTKG